MELPEHMFGDENEWLRFTQRLPDFFRVFDTLNVTIRRVLIRTFHVDNAAKELVHFIGRLTIEDFMETLLLAGNGYGVAALKILRGQYERTVSAAYIAKFPESAQRFVEFGSVQYRRMLNQAKELYGDEGLRVQLSPGKIEEIEQAYQEVKDKFTEPLCKKCGTTRTSFSWSDLDTASMALKAGYGLDKLYFHCYTIPTQQAHASVLSVLSRRVELQDGTISFNEAAQHEEADAALSFAHALMLRMLRVQNDFFHLGFEEEIGQRYAEYQTVWNRSTEQGS
jgi:hypothetical protein